MTESLLSFSNIFLFGQRVDELEINITEEAQQNVRLASIDRITPFPPSSLIEVDDIDTVAGNRVLVKNQRAARRNGIYTVQDGADWDRTNFPDGHIVNVAEGNSNSGTRWRTKRRGAGANARYEFTEFRARLGANNQLSGQLTDEACLAKIYGFSYEGGFYDLARPALFLVHGDGELLTERSNRKPFSRPARAPRESSDTGLSVTDFQFSDDMRVWSYDKGDFSIRMDVTTGMLEDILLEAEVDVQMTSAAKAQTAGAAKVQISHAAKVQIARRSDR